LPRHEERQKHPKVEEDIRKEEGEEEEKSKTTTTSSTAISKRVLVVDDERDAADVFKIGLEQSGFEVDAYTTPSKVLSNFKVGYYNIIISDVRMPEMNGFELCSELVKMDDKIKVFFVSGFLLYSEEMKLLYPSIKSQHFIDKPVSIEKLVKTIIMAD
jgi:DNA-binding response OmpR family regulator